MYNLYNAYSGNGSCCYVPKIPNGYAFPAPLRKEQKRLDVTQLTIHEDVNVRTECLPNGCCPPEPVLVEDIKKSFVISTCLCDCLAPGFYYTLNIDREVPIEAFGLDTYISVEKAPLFRGEVGLNKTRVIHNGWRDKGESVITGNAHDDRLESVEIDGGMGSQAYDEIGGGHGYAHGGCPGAIPEDPAFPAQGIFGCGCGFKRKGSVLIPVVLDLLGNIATGKNFTTGRFPANGYLPYNNRYTLFLNNAGKFVLSRPFTRRSDYA